MGESEDRVKNDVTITFETLFELLQREKHREEIQPLDENFFRDLVDYIRSKKQLLKSKKEESDDGFSNEAKNIEIQLQNLNKIIKELYGKREKKITFLALTKVRTNASIFDSSKLLSEEREIYETLISIFSKSRSDVLSKLLAGDMPNSAQGGALNFISGDNEETEKTKTENPSEMGEMADTVHKVDAANAGDSVKKNESDEAQSDESEIGTTVRFMHSVPRFVGSELETYGPFEEDEIARLPKEIADVLIKKERAEALDCDD